MKSNRKKYSSEAAKASEDDASKIYYSYYKVVWNCVHCLCSKEDAGFIKLGPNGVESLCESCGSYYEVHEELPDHRLNLCKYAV